VSSDTDVLTSIEWEVSECLTQAHYRASVLQDVVETDTSDADVGEWDHNGGVVLAVPRSEQKYYWSDCVLRVQNVR